jgi:ABC-type nitrate/sulfonate/bicarbonate transport system substrate-binding protein
MMTFVRLSRLVAVVAALLLFAACADDQDEAAVDDADAPDTETDDEPDDEAALDDDRARYVLDESTPLEVGAIPGGQGFVLFVMDQEGIAQDYNIDLEIRDFLNPPALHTALAEGAVNVGFGGLAPMAQARDQGRDVVAFNVLGGPPTVVATPEDSGVESLADLEGGQLGSFSGTSGATFAILTALGRETEGVDLATETEVIEAAPPALQGLLDQGELDAALLDTIFSIRVQLEDGYRILAQIPTDYADEVGGDPAHVVMTSSEAFMSENEAVIVAFVAAYQDTMAFIEDNPEVWDQFAEDMELDDPNAGEVTREFLGGTYVTTWDEDQLAVQEALLETLIEIEADDAFLSEIPDGFFDLELQPDRWEPEE